MKAKGKDYKTIGQRLLANADAMEDDAEIKEQGESLAAHIVKLTNNNEHLRAVYHRTSAMLTALFTQLNTGGKSYEQIVIDEGDDLPPVDWSEA